MFFFINLQTSNEGSASKVETQQQLQQHDVKVRFIREFADAPSTTVREGIPETSSLSSASSFQSLASTLSSKCSSGICVDSSPNKSANNSYLSPEITGLDDLISACENIRLDDPAKDQSFELRVDSEDNSPDTTFTSATDRNSPNCTREISPINLEDQVHPNLNITSDIDKPVSPINQPSSTDQNLNITTEITSPALPIDNEADCNFNITRDIESDLSSIAKEPDSNLNVPGEIHRENSPGICRKEENVNLNVIVEIHGDNSQEIGENLDVDLAEEIEKESAFFCSQGNSLLNVTTDITDNPTIDHPNEPNLDLDSTRVISRENSPAKCPSDFNFELDTTREVTREFSSLNREALATEESEILNENSADSLTNSDTHTLEFVDALSTSPNLEKSNESFVQCVSDIAQLPESKESELLAKNFESDIGNSEILKSTSDDSKDGLKGYEDCPLELITPSLSEFHENLCSPNFELVDKTEISLVQNLPNFSVQEVKIPNESGDFVDKSEEIVKDTTTETIIPGLPSLSSIHLPPELNESTNLLVLESPPKQIDKSNENQDQSPHPSGTEKTGEIPIKDCSSLEKFVTAVSSENCSRNSLSAIQEPTFFSANNLLDTSLNVRDRGTGISAVLPPLDKPILPVTANCTVPEITSHSVTEDIATHLKKERTRGEEFNSSRNTDQDSNNRELASNEYHSEEEEGFIRLEAGIANAEIEKESFPEIGKKGNNSNEELDVTVTADDLTIDEIPESDQFAKFLPQRQSTTFEPKEKLEPQKSTLVAGGTGGHNFVCPSVPVNDNYEQFKPQKRSTSLDHFKSPVSSKPERQKTHYLTAFSIPEESSIIEKSGKSFPSKNISNVDNRCNFEQLEVAANSVANDIFNSSLNFPEENEHFVSAESEGQYSGISVSNKFRISTNFSFFPIFSIKSAYSHYQLSEKNLCQRKKTSRNRIFLLFFLLFKNLRIRIFYFKIVNIPVLFSSAPVFHDPSNFEFLLSKTPRKNTKRNLRDLSLYVKFDPLVSNTSMLPQGNIQNASPPANEARNGENNTAMPNVGSPKRNPAIAAIDRLLFYSPMSGNTTPTNTNTTIQKTNDTQEKLVSQMSIVSREVIFFFLFLFLKKSFVFKVVS